MEKNIYEGITLLIRGGGVKTASSLGVLKALEEHNIPIKEVSGTSIGSIPAALIGCGFKADDILKFFIDYNYRIIRSFNLLGGKGSAMIEQYIMDYIQDKTFDNTNIPVFINASNGPFYNATPLIFSQETTPDIRLAEACRGAACFPFIYKPYKKSINGINYSLTDGGSTLNPYIPETSNPLIYSTFISNREKKFIKRGLHEWEKPPYVAEAASDIIIKPDLQATGTTGNIKKIIEAYYLGYEEANKVIDSLSKEPNNKHHKL